MPMLEPIAAAVPASSVYAWLGQTMNTDDFSLTGFSTDTRTLAPGNCFLAIKGEFFNGNLYADTAAQKGAALCILSEPPQTPLGIPYLLVEDTVAAYGQIAAGYLQWLRETAGTTVIAVTGSSGKTTVKDMAAHVLSKQFRTIATAGNHNNHIGLPYTILHLPTDTEFAVLEMGMNHAGEISALTRIAKPDCGLITNIGTAHIGNLGSQDAIFHAKLELTEGMNPETAWLNLPAEDAYLTKTAEIPFPAARIRYSSRMGHTLAALQAVDITEWLDATHFTVTYDTQSAVCELPMTGLHNVSNALIAIQTGLTYGMTLADATAALADFAPTALRSDRMTVGSWHIIRDYYNANPEAMRASLQALQTIAGSAPKIAVLGNMNELGDYAADSHHALGVLCKETVDAALFYGPNHSDFAAGYGSADTAFAEQSDLLEALRRLLAGYGDTPLYLLVKGSRGMHMEYVLDGLLGDTE